MHFMVLLMRLSFLKNEVVRDANCYHGSKYTPRSCLIAFSSSVTHATATLYNIPLLLDYQSLYLSVNSVKGLLVR
jgi:hypothetical protein